MPAACAARRLDAGAALARASKADVIDRSGPRRATVLALIAALLPGCAGLARTPPLSEVQRVHVFPVDRAGSGVEGEAGAPLAFNWTQVLNNGLEVGAIMGVSTGAGGLVCGPGAPVCVPILAGVGAVVGFGSGVLVGIIQEGVSPAGIDFDDRESLREAVARATRERPADRAYADAVAACAAAAGLGVAGPDDAELVLRVEIAKLGFERGTDTDRVRLRAVARVTPLAPGADLTQRGNFTDLSHASEYAAFDFWLLDDGARVRQALDGAYAALAPRALEALGRPAPSGCAQSRP